MILKALLALVPTIALLAACMVPTTGDLRNGAERSASTIDQTLNGTDGTLPSDVGQPTARPARDVN